MIDWLTNPETIMQYLIIYMFVIGVFFGWRLEWLWRWYRSGFNAMFGCCE